MNLTRIYAIFLRQMLLLRHNKTRFFNIFLWIGLDIVLWGFITKYLDSLGNLESSFVPSLLGALILWDFLIRIQQGVMLAFFEDVWSRNFLNLFASPLTVKEYVTGLVATGIVTSTAGLLFMLLLAGFAFGYTAFALGLSFFLFLSILFIFGLALGILGASLVFRLGPSAEWLAWPIPFILGPFSGVFYPIATLPNFLQPISKIIPPSYAFEGMRGVLAGQAVDIPLFFTGAILSIVYLVAAYFVFLSVYRFVLKTGLITRFSAENTSV